MRQQNYIYKQKFVNDQHKASLPSLAVISFNWLSPTSVFVISYHIMKAVEDNDPLAPHKAFLEPLDVTVLEPPRSALIDIWVWHPLHGFTIVMTASDLEI